MSNAFILFGIYHGSSFGGNNPQIIDVIKYFESVNTLHGKTLQCGVVLVKC
jgi:hypothetical protein